MFSHKNVINVYYSDGADVITHCSDCSERDMSLIACVGRRWRDYNSLLLQICYRDTLSFCRPASAAAAWKRRQSDDGLCWWHGTL